MAEATKRGAIVKIRKNDTGVEVIAGKDAGKRGKVLKVLREKGRPSWRGELHQAHTRPNPQRKASRAAIARA